MSKYMYWTVYTVNMMYFDEDISIFTNTSCMNIERGLPWSSPISLMTLAAEIRRFRYVKGEIFSWKLTCPFLRWLGKWFSFSKAGIVLFQSWDFPFPKLGYVSVPWRVKFSSQYGVFFWIIGPDHIKHREQFQKPWTISKNMYDTFICT